MYGKNLRNTLLAGAAALAMGLGSQAASAMTVLDSWNFNLAAANGVAFTLNNPGGVGGGAATSFSGLADTTNIDHGVLQGISTIEQEVVGGVALGNRFRDNGVLGFNSYVAEGAIFDTSHVLGDAGSLYFEFVNLTGTLHPDNPATPMIDETGSITFDPGVGTIRLVLESDFDGDSSTGDVLELATFQIIAPSGGSALDFHGGTAANSTIDITLEQLTGIAGLYTDSLNNPIAPSPFNLHLGNVNALLDPNFTPNPDPTAANGCALFGGPGVDGMGNGCTVVHVQNEGQYNIRVDDPPNVAEPGTLAALGFGLVAMGGLTARRRRKAA